MVIVWGIKPPIVYWDGGHSFCLNGTLKYRVGVPGRWSQCLAEWGIKIPAVSVLGRWSQCLAQWSIKTLSKYTGTMVAVSGWVGHQNTDSQCTSWDGRGHRLAKCDNRTLESMSWQWMVSVHSNSWLTWTLGYLGSVSFGWEVVTVSVFYKVGLSGPWWQWNQCRDNGQYPDWLGHQLPMVSVFGRWSVSSIGQDELVVMTLKSMSGQWSASQ